MGVHGLWRLIEPSGKPVPLETLENKILAVDVSIWLHQAIKGFQDSRGSPLQNAHLLSLYHRICKLLYFKIKPIFVFDGGVPVLKKQTIAKRNQLKTKNQTEAERIHKTLLNTLLKHTAIKNVLSEKTKAIITSPIKQQSTIKNNNDDLYYLPQIEEEPTNIINDKNSSDSDDTKPRWDLHTIDTNSVEFKALPADVRHEILTDLKDTRKQSSWGRIHELPTESNDFSNYQMNRLLKRQSVQQAIENAEKEMGGHSLSLNELEKLLNDQGIITKNNEIGSRIASDENTKYLLIKDLKRKIENAKKINLDQVNGDSDTSSNTSTTSELNSPNSDNSKMKKTKADEEYENDLQKAIILSLQDEPSTSKETFSDIVIRNNKSNNLELSFLDDSTFFDSESSSCEEEFQIETNKLKLAQHYMLEYSGLTPNEIERILKNKTDNKKHIKSGKNKEIIKEFFKINNCEVTKNWEKNTEDEKELMKQPLNKNIEEKEIKEALDEEIPTEYSDKNNKLETKDDSGESKIKEKIIEETEDDKINLYEIEKPLIDNEEQQTEKNEEKHQSDQSDSDGSDFLEVDEVTNNIQCETNKNEDGIQIIIKPYQNNIEDDLFNDVFINNEENKSDLIESKDECKDNIELKNKISLKDKIRNALENKDFNDKTNDKQLPVKNIVKKKLTVDELKEMNDDLCKEQDKLLEEKTTKERLASNITEQMYQETQELLELFGIPYIIAPMEAEAQCAFLDEIDLTDGTITDDSDIWLFGGKTVYKNFFNNKKHVLEFKSEDIAYHFKLTRMQMILLALLVGSDYTTGLLGVGPVTALEILSAFPLKSSSSELNLSHSQLLSGLREFRLWFNNNNNSKTLGRSRNALRNKLKSVSIHDNFPSKQVVEAYLSPTIETSKEKFSWGKPNVAGLVEFARIKFGWTKKKTDEILNPILKRIADKKSQSFIKDYFKTKFKVDDVFIKNKISKRVKTVLERLDKNESDKKEDDKLENKTKRKLNNPQNTMETKRLKKSDNLNGTSEQDNDIKILKQTKEQSKVILQKMNDTFKEELIPEKKNKALRNLHKKDVIPQKQKDKTDSLRTKMRAIELYRKSKSGPGYIPRKKRIKEPPKEDIGLSESSDD